MSKDAALPTARVTRREFLNYAWLASLGIFPGEVAGVSYLFAISRFKKGEFGSSLRWAG